MIDDDGPGAGAGCKETLPARAQQVIVMQDEEPPCPSDAQRAHGKEAREVIVIEDSGNEPRQPSIFCKKPRPADEQTPGRKDARAGATSKKPSDPLFEALRPMCMRQAQPTPLQPFTDVLQIHSVSKFLAWRMQWGRAAAGMEAVGPPSDSICDSVEKCRGY